MSDNCFYTVTDNPKFYIKDEYGNLKEFGKFASADTDLITCGEGSNFFEMKKLNILELLQIIQQLLDVILIMSI